MKMKVRALKTTLGSYGLLPRGKSADIPDYEAKELIALGYVAAEIPVEKLVAAPQNAKLEVANDNDPFEGRRPGGLIGEDKQQSSSQEGRQRRKRRSTSQEDDAA
ncbi:MAG TPA: hypothetical protein VFT58_05450 [Nitrososphaera sp.]|nr:hypothetical protein [Nitrososphaera sp.]